MHKIIIILLLIKCGYVVPTPQIRNIRIQNILQESKRGILPVMNKKIQKLRSVEICYESVGCFEIPRHHNPLQKIPENPDIVDTQFYLFKRDNNFSSPDILRYGDNFQSIRNSKFDLKRPLKIIIHGYMTKWNEDGAFAGVKTYLDIEDCNVILLNWERGARGPNYGIAAANTELVGRQLGFLLLDLTSLGINLDLVHLIGFSLGAHVAACAAQVLKDRGFILGRITGLDPASPLFKLNHFRDNRKKLDASDARYVDVIHTDGSPVFTDGFGLLKPVGHVDFFPNGGREQPGCSDVRASVVVSHFERTLDREIACSHIRAYRLFLETLLQKSSKNKRGCEFTAYSCPKGIKDFASGRCFPIDDINSKTRLDKKFRTDLGRLGEDSFGRGPMYLITRSNPPFCGIQLQTSVTISPQIKRNKGILFLNLQHGNYTTQFQVNCDVADNTYSRIVHDIEAAEFESINDNIVEMYANIFYVRMQKDGPNLTRSIFFIEKISIQTLDGLSWETCGKMSILPDTPITLILMKGHC